MPNPDEISDMQPAGAADKLPSYKSFGRRTNRVVQMSLSPLPSNEISMTFVDPGKYFRFCIDLRLRIAICDLAVLSSSPQISTVVHSSLDGEQS
jgi:hypothetical protein